MFLFRTVTKVVLFHTFDFVKHLIFNYVPTFCERDHSHVKGNQ